MDPTAARANESTSKITFLTVKSSSNLLEDFF